MRDGSGARYDPETLAVVLARGGSTAITRRFRARSSAYVLPVQVWLRARAVCCPGPLTYGFEGSRVIQYSVSGVTGVPKRAFTA
jgi:hypothetical protein